MPPSTIPGASVSRQLRELYRRHGYSQYRMSKFEPYDLYARNKSFLVSEHILTFTDTDGRLMALKPDVTLSIVKNTTLDDTGTLEKVYYHENVYRTSPASMGYREIPQTGLECIGALDDYAIGEVLTLAIQSLEMISPEYLLDLGHMGVIAGALEGLEGAPRRTLLLELGRKNVTAIRTLCARAEVDRTRTEQLCRLAELYGHPQEVFPMLESLVQESSARAALDELKALTTLLEALGLGEHLRLDFSVVGGMRYYNGLIFRGYLPGLPDAVLAGGRYDDLLRQMGKRGGAIGFAVYLDRLERFQVAPRGPDGDILLLYGPSDAPLDVAKAAQEMAKDGSVVRVERQPPKGLVFRRTVHFGAEREET